MLTQKDVEVMLAADKGPWRPAWRGAASRCRALEKAGLMKECGTSAMPPHVLFCLTADGRSALLRHCAENF